MSKIKEEILFPKSRAQLTRRDLLIYEDRLCHDLRSFIEFDSHALYFPVADELKNYEYIAEEKSFFCLFVLMTFCWGFCCSKMSKPGI